jgi:hypothetical protein
MSEEKGGKKLGEPRAEGEYNGRWANRMGYMERKAEKERVDYSSSSSTVQQFRGLALILSMDSVPCFGKLGIMRSIIPRAPQSPDSSSTTLRGGLLLRCKTMDRLLRSIIRHTHPHTHPPATLSRFHSRPTPAFDISGRSSP